MASPRTREPNKDRLRLWVEALRSGRFQQGNGAMRNLTGHCCLGVAMEVAFANGVEPYISDNWGVTSTMPERVRDWYGIGTGTGVGENGWLDPEADPFLEDPRGGDPRRASVLNDDGVPFSEIADRIVHTFGLED